MNPLRVLIVDDSATNRAMIARVITQMEIAEVLGYASTGAEALRLVRQLSPDVVTLDLEMPEMDGFSFLRVLMGSRPTPVIVVSSYAGRENVFRALELGALDFVAKQRGEPEEAFRLELEKKLALVRQARRKQHSIVPPPRPDRPLTPAHRLNRSPRHVVAITASTGGPSALLQILSQLPLDGAYSILIAQHMPPRFTPTFAERLNRFSPLRVSEAKNEQPVLAGHALVCPGDSCMALEKTPNGALRVRLSPPLAEERYIPNGSRLLRSVGRVLSVRAVGVVLTGMGDDGSEGAAEIARRGGRVIVESEETAVVYGMPHEARKRVPNCDTAPLGELAALLRSIVT